ncbi:MAG: Clp protease N-terminal domain-containing protein [Actinobacteria bacterium]|nr:Clp protease N-terminal domain-containing protein [Actinomycetota bacterium]
MGAGTSGPLTLVPRRAGVAISHRSGHTHVDSDHVLLGLLIIDGESAKQLRAAGVNLDPARTAMAAMARDDLASIGVSDEGWADEPRLSKAFGFDDSCTTYRLAERSPGELIAWEATFPGRGGLLRARRPYAEYLRVEIAPDTDGNCCLTLSLRVDREGRHRLLDCADDQTTAIRLNLIAQALAQAS